MKILTICTAFLFFGGQSLFAQECCSFLTGEEIDTFYEQGFFVKRHAFDQEELDLMDEISWKFMDVAFDEIAKETYPFSQERQITYINGTQVVFTKPEGKDPSLYRVVGCAGIEPKVLDILRSEKMANTFFNLLGCDQIEQIICQFHPKLPHDGVQFIKHRDIQYRKSFDPSWEDVLGNGSYAVCIIALDPMFLENGCLLADRSSYPIGANRGEEDVVVLTMKPGDMIFMHPDLLHWSYENQSEISRRALLTGFCAFGANHRMYPGSYLNECLLREEDGIAIAPAPWKILSNDPLAWTLKEGSSAQPVDH